MSDNVYEALLTKNSRLARFTDQNENVAKLLMKIITHLEQYSRESRIPMKSLPLDIHGSPDGRSLLVNLDGGTGNLR